MDRLIREYQAFVLILLTSVLLGIWATVHTVALRNILLIITAILAAIYLKNTYRNHYSLCINSCLSKPHILYLLPVILIGTMFIWVLVHYLFFSQFPEKQWDELTSTWLRSFLASIIGFGCALALNRNKSTALLLWLGLIVSFLILFSQYIPKAFVNKSFFAPDYYGNYIYWAKFNGVLAGTILFVGVLGYLIDRARHKSIFFNQEQNYDSQFNNFVRSFTIILGLLLPIYSFVFIFTAKNGMGVAAIVLFFWFLIAGFYLFRSLWGKKHRLVLSPNWLWLTIIYFIIYGSFSVFAYHHIKNNQGWSSLIEDISISAQIDKYQNWKDIPKFGLPRRADGSSVAGNTYERTALALVGIRLVSGNPVGNGVLRGLHTQMRQGGIEYDHYVYTHSAWIDLGLSYGWPGLFLLPTALILCLILCAKESKGYYRATTASIVISILILYLVGEYAFQHGIEILFFICSLTAGLCWHEKMKNIKLQ